MEKYLIDNMSNYVGRNVNELKTRFGICKADNKSTYIEIAYKMAGVSSNGIKELRKSNIVLKTIRINIKDKIKENMSFPTITFKELIDTEWENSFIYDYFAKTKFLFVIYKETDKGYVYLGSFFWKMPINHLNNIVKDEWKSIKDTIKEGVLLELKNGIVLNNLPKKSRSKIIHLRPKASKAAYLLKNGFTIGDIAKDADQLPNGEYMTKQCFWINNDYIYRQIERNSILVYSSNSSLVIDEYQRDLVMKNLHDDFYLYDDFKQIVCIATDLKDKCYFNAATVDKLGFNFGISYVYSKKYSSIFEYIGSLLIENDLVNLVDTSPKLLEIPNVNEMLDELVKKNPIVRIDKYVFISLERLYRRGLPYNMLTVFSKKIVNDFWDDYFTIHLLRSNSNYDDMFSGGFNDCFYEDIIMCCDNLDFFVCEAKKVFYNIGSQCGFLEFIESLVSERLKIDFFEFKEILQTKYGLNISEVSLSSSLQLSNLYYNNDIGKIYYNREEFLFDLKSSNLSS